MSAERAAAQPAAFRPGWRVLLPVLVAVASLVGLVLVMFAVQRRVDALREDLGTVAEPARAELNHFIAAISKEMSAQRGYMLFRDTAFVTDESDGRLEEGEMDGRVDRLVGRLGGSAVPALARLQEVTVTWRRSPGDPSTVMSLPRDEALRLVLQRQVVFEQVLDAARDLDRAIRREEEVRLEQITEYDSIRIALAVALVGLALGAVLGLVRVAAQLRALGDRSRALADESERRRRALEEVAEEKGRFVRGITHDLKNPLGAIDAYAQLLEAGVRGPMPPEQAEYVARIRRVTQECVGILNDLLHLARAEAAQLRIDHAPTDLAQVVRETAEDYRAAIAANDFRFALELPEGLPPVHTDGRRVREILGNLLSNALKHTPAGGRITVALAEGRHVDGACVLLSVTDTGPGIAPAERERIFGEFTRLRPDAVHGSGIGLAISRQIAHLLGGDLTVGGMVGQGAVFTLRIPCDDAAPAGARPRLATVG